MVGKCLKINLWRNPWTFLSASSPSTFITCGCSRLSVIYLFPLLLCILLILTSSRSTQRGFLYSLLKYLLFSPISPMVYKKKVTNWYFADMRMNFAHNFIICPLNIEILNARIEYGEWLEAYFDIKKFVSKICDECWNDSVIRQIEISK